MRWLTILLLAACAAETTGEAPAPPQRIVSLDHCADQHVLALAGRDQILALSPGATGDYAYLAEEAQGLPTVRPAAEDVLALRPDVIVRSYGGGPRAAQLFERAGVPVLEIGWPSTLEDVAANTERIAAAFGQPERAAPLVAAMHQRADKRGERALYLTPSGVTTGPGSLVHETLEAAGLTNHETRPGWHDIPLEQLVRQQPDRVVTAFFSSEDRFEGRWDALRHPVARRVLGGVPRTDLDGSLVACAAFPLGEAVRILREAPR